MYGAMTRCSFEIYHLVLSGTSKALSKCVVPVQSHEGTISRRHNLRWIWIDTCCIDKDSSAEFCAAINTVVAWYEGARVCYAYLRAVCSAVTVAGGRTLKVAALTPVAYCLIEEMCIRRVTYNEIFDKVEKSCVESR